MIKPTPAVFLLAGLFLACGGSEPAPEGAAGAGGKGFPPAPDACKVLTAEDLQQVLAVAVQGKPVEQLQGIETTSTCSYATTEGEQPVVSLVIQVGKSPDPQTNLTDYADTLKAAVGADYPLDAVEGLSAPALWNPDMKQLTAFKGHNAAIFTMYDARGQDPVEAAKTLAGKALPRM